DVTERPIIKSCRRKIGKAAWSIEIVPRRTGKTGMQDADVDCAFDSGFVLANQVFRCMRMREAQTVDRHRKLALRPVDRHRLGVATEHLYRIWKSQLLGDP